MNRSTHPRLFQVKKIPSHYRGEAKKSGERNCLHLYGISVHAIAQGLTQEDIKMKVEYLLSSQEGYPYLQGDPEENNVSLPIPFCQQHYLIASPGGCHRILSSGSQGTNQKVLLR